MEKIARKSHKNYKNINFFLITKNDNKINKQKKK